MLKELKAHNVTEHIWHRQGNVKCHEMQSHSQFFFFFLELLQCFSLKHSRVTPLSHMINPTFMSPQQLSFSRSDPHRHMVNIILLISAFDLAIRCVSQQV